MYTRNPEPTEQHVLQQLAQGHEGAATSIYRQHYPIVSRWLMARGCTADDAADIFQEGMVILFQKATDPAFTLTCQVGTYLLAVCKRLWLRKAEQLGKRPAQLDDEAGDEGQDWAYEETIAIHEEREAHYQMLEDALAHIGEPCQSILRAYYHHDKSMAQIANDFGYTNPENAKTQKYKCLMRLKKIFFGSNKQ